MADYKFYVDHGSNPADAAAFMISFIDFADGIFRASQFGSLSNIGVDAGKACI